MRIAFAIVLAALAAHSGACPMAQAGEPGYKCTMKAAVQRGAIVFAHYCALCHGANADGKGRAASLYLPRPADLTRSDASDEYKEAIIRNGGAALARSPYMPPWGDLLSDEQIADLIVHLRALRNAAAR